MLHITLPEMTRDLVILAKGDSITVQLEESLADDGWLGGSFAKWVQDPRGFPTVQKADGRYCGFFLFGSNEGGDQYTAITGQNPHYSYATLQFGGNVGYTNTYERYGYKARHGLGPVVPLTYTANQLLYVSENGILTNENESDLTTYEAHDFPDGDPVPDMSFIAFGLCMTPPADVTNQYIGIQTNIGV